MTPIPPQLPAPGKSPQTIKPARPADAGQRLRSLTRLLVGSTENGLDELWDSLQRWEAEVDAQGDSGENLTDLDTLEGEFTDDDLILVKPDRPAQTARYALIGLIFEGQEHLAPGIKTLAQIESSLERAARPVTHSSIFSPLRKAYSKLVARGQSEVDHWVETGRREEARSRRLAQTAVKTSVDSSINYLTNNPEVQQLVQTQSTGLATEVVEEIRERTFSADTYLETWLRKIFRMKPRAAISGPPDEVRLSAVPVPTRKSDTLR